MPRPDHLPAFALRPVRRLCRAQAPRLGFPRNDTSASRSAGLRSLDGRHAWPAADDHFSQRLRTHARGDVHKRRIVSGPFQVRTVARLALLLVERTPSRDRRGAAGSATAARRGRFGAQLVDRRHVDAQHVHDALRGVGRRAAPVGAALRAGDRDRVLQRRRSEQPVITRIGDALLPRFTLFGRQNIRIDVVYAVVSAARTAAARSETAEWATPLRREFRSGERAALRWATRALP